jgi:hypothetical protein
MLSLGNNNTNNDSLLQDLDLFFQLGLDLVDELGVTTKSDFIRGGISAFPWESNETSLLERFLGSTGIDNDFSKVSSSLTNKGSVLSLAPIP